MNRRIVSTLLTAARRGIRTVAPGEHTVLQHGKAAAAASDAVKQRSIRTYGEGIWEHESLREPLPRQASALGPVPGAAASSASAAGTAKSAAAQQEDAFALREDHSDGTNAAAAPQRRWTAATGVKPGSVGPVVSPPIGARRFATRAGSSKPGPSGFDVSESTGYDPASTETLKSGSGGGAGSSSGRTVKQQAAATADRAAYAAANTADNMSAKASSATNRAANTAADAAEKLGAKTSAALGGAAAELRKPAEDIAADAAAAATRGAKRAGAAVSEAVRAAGAPEGSRMTEDIPSATGAGASDSEATLREELEATAEYPFETGVTPPSYLKGGNPEGRDLNAELPADLEESGGFYAESGITTPSSVGLDVPLDGDPNLKRMAGAVRTGQIPH